MSKAILFDMDGVIINSQASYFKIEQKLFKLLGIKISTNEHHSLFGMSSIDFWGYIKKKYHLSQSVDELRSWSKQYYQKYFHETNFPELVPGLVEFIELVKNEFMITVASSASPITIEKNLERFDLKKYFKVITSAHEVQLSKPNPDVFLRAAEKIFQKPSECIVIEDSHNGVIAAKAAKMICIGFQNPSSGNQDLSLADLIINNYKELTIDILMNL